MGQVLDLTPIPAFPRQGGRRFLFPEDGHQDVAIMGGSAMFIEINALPGAERQTAVAYRQVEAAVREDAADMGRHVIVTLSVMAKDRIAVSDQTAQKGFEVAAHHRIGVLAQHERGAGVLYEHMA